MDHKIVNGESVPLTEAESAALRQKWARIDVEKRKSAYLKQRRLAYPTVEDQLDYMYHNGFDAWKIMIKEIKDRYPKPIL